MKNAKSIILTLIVIFSCFCVVIGSLVLGFVIVKKNVNFGNDEKPEVTVIPSVAKPTNITPTEIVNTKIAILETQRDQNIIDIIEFKYPESLKLNISNEKENGINIMIVDYEGSRMYIKPASIYGEESFKAQGGFSDYKEVTSGFYRVQEKKDQTMIKYFYGSMQKSEYVCKEVGNPCFRNYFSHDLNFWNYHWRITLTTPLDNDPMVLEIFDDLIRSARGRSQLALTYMGVFPTDEYFGSNDGTSYIYFKSFSSLAEEQGFEIMYLLRSDYLKDYPELKINTNYIVEGSYSAVLESMPMVYKFYDIKKISVK